MYATGEDWYKDGFSMSVLCCTGGGGVDLPLINATFSTLEGPPSFRKFLDQKIVNITSILIP